MSTRMVEKCRAVKLIFVIVFTFFICWTPYNVVILLKAIKTSSGDPDNCSEALDYALYITRNFAYLYCCISPVFYTFLGKKFQSHFLKILSKRMPCLKNNALMSMPSSKTTSIRSPTTSYWSFIAFCSKKKHRIQDAMFALFDHKKYMVNNFSFNGY